MIPEPTKESLAAREAELDQYKNDIDEKNEIVSSGNEAVKVDRENRRNALRQQQDELNQRFETLRAREAKLCKCQK